MGLSFWSCLEGEGVVHAEVTMYIGQGEKCPYEVYLQQFMSFPL